MALFAAAVLALLIIFRADFLRVAVTNIWINGAIIGVALFGGLACFADMFRLLPEYKWMKNYFRGAKLCRPAPGFAASDCDNFARPRRNFITNKIKFNVGNDFKPVRRFTRIDTIYHQFVDFPWVTGHFLGPN